eukprot:gene3688-4246_t
MTSPIPHYPHLLQQQQQHYHQQPDQPTCLGCPPDILGTKTPESQLKRIEVDPVIMNHQDLSQCFGVAMNGTHSTIYLCNPCFGLFLKYKLNTTNTNDLDDQDGEGHLTPIPSYPVCPNAQALYSDANLKVICLEFLNTLKASELSAILRKIGSSLKGTKRKLIERLLRHIFTYQANLSNSRFSLDISSMSTSDIYRHLRRYTSTTPKAKQTRLEMIPMLIFYYCLQGPDPQSSSLSNDQSPHSPPGSPLLCASIPYSSSPTGDLSSSLSSSPQISRRGSPRRMAHSLPYSFTPSSSAPSPTSNMSQPPYARKYSSPSPLQYQQHHQPYPKISAPPQLSNSDALFTITISCSAPTPATSPPSKPVGTVPSSLANQQNKGMMGAITEAHQQNLDLALIGNCSFGALIDKKSTIKWCCIPRFDADPIFCSLVRKTNDLGFYDVVIENYAYSEQSYIKNTAVLVTKLYNNNGAGVEITDFAPRFNMFSRPYRPSMLIRIIKPFGSCRIKVRLRPTFGYGWGSPEKTRGTNHIRFLLPSMVMRLTTNAPISYIVDEVLFEVDEPLYFVFMADESLREALNEVSNTYLEKTVDYWHEYTKTLTIPLEWQSQVLRACITVKLCQFEESGAIIASITSSIPESPTKEGFDLRDTAYIIHTFNKLGNTKMMEDFLTYLSNIVSGSQENGGVLQPVYGISLETKLYEKSMYRLAGYRGMGPVKIGTRDYKFIQNDVYGHLILASIQMFYDQRLQRPGDLSLFEKLEGLGIQAYTNYNKPDTGPKGTGLLEEGRIYTYSSVMCWAGCDRLGKIANTLKLPDRATFWKDTADKIKKDIIENAYNAEMNSFVTHWGGSHVDPYLLLLVDTGFLVNTDPKLTGTLAKIEESYRVGKYIVDGPGSKTAVTTQTLLYIIALAKIGRKDEARDLFENILNDCTSLGLLSQDINLETKELWGNLPKTTSMVAIIQAAIVLSNSWESEI